MIEVSWQVEGLQPSDLMNLALVQNQAEDRVETGENGGRTLKHVNVVRGFRVVNSAKEKDSLSLTIPDGLEAKDLHVVAYLQAPPMPTFMQWQRAKSSRVNDGTHGFRLTTMNRQRNDCGASSRSNLMAH